jgi:hypothetical protein
LAATSIPKTAEVRCEHGQILDPYDECDLLEESYQVRRNYFVRFLGSDVWIWSGDLPAVTWNRIWERKAEPTHEDFCLPAAVHDALHEVASQERCKLYDIIMHGIDAALKKRGYLSETISRQARSDRPGKRCRVAAQAAAYPLSARSHPPVAAARVGQDTAWRQRQGFHIHTADSRPVLRAP